MTIKQVLLTFCNFFLFVLVKTGPCSLGWPQTPYEDKAGLEFLGSPPMCWDYSMSHRAGLCGIEGQTQGFRYVS